jgi:hypothetical protein
LSAPTSSLFRKLIVRFFGGKGNRRPGKTIASLFNSVINSQYAVE